MFILSPADCAGPRATRLQANRWDNAVGRALHGPDGVSIGALFSAISQLYFRGKLAYAERFAGRDASGPAIRVVTSTMGLVGPDLKVDPSLLAEFAAGAIDIREEAYLAPLLASARCDLGLLENPMVVFLGSVATDKYVQPLVQVFGSALHIPEAFVGMGNMQRGSVLLKAVEANRELDYVQACP